MVRPSREVASWVVIPAHHYFVRFSREVARRTDAVVVTRGGAGRSLSGPSFRRKSESTGDPADGRTSEIGHAFDRRWGQACDEVIGGPGFRRGDDGMTDLEV